MKYLSLFSGIGGFELGIKQAYEQILQSKDISSLSNREEKDKTTRDSERQCGELSDKPPTGFTCIGYSEIDKYAIQIYQKHFPNHKNYGDITTINENELPDFEFLCGGFPCQSFSIAGKRGGFNDTRGTMFFHIARILKAKRPRLLLLENVKGLLSHDQGKTFATIISTLDELGYDLQWQVLNSKNFGVPQNRERVFIVGHLRGTPRSEVFPFGESTRVGDDQNENAISSTITSCYWKGLSGGRQGLVELTENASQGYRTYDTSGISTTLASQAGGVGAKTGLYAHTVRSSGRGSGIDKKQNWDSYEIKGKIRRLTPTECERLQGFPDGWTEGVSDTQRYKTLGNAVTVNVIKAIIEKLL